MLDKPDLAGRAQFTSRYRGGFAAILNMAMLLLTSPVEKLPNVTIEIRLVRAGSLDASPAGERVIDHSQLGLAAQDNDPPAAPTALSNPSLPPAYASARTFAAARIGQRPAIDETFATHAFA